ncbi:14000_t:CDS:2, partial [Entrophospora sp. SA101]
YPLHEFTNEKDDMLPDYIRELYHILEPVYEATKLLSSSSSYPTIGDVRLAFICMFITPDHYLNALQQSMNFSKTWRIFLD